MSVDVESEAMLEEKFIEQLQSMGYDRIKIKKWRTTKCLFKWIFFTKNIRN